MSEHAYFLTDDEWETVKALRAGTARVVLVRPGHVSCGHAAYSEGHCAEMSCDNYINKHRSL